MKKSWNLNCYILAVDPHRRVIVMLPLTFPLFPWQRRRIFIAGLTVVSCVANSRHRNTGRIYKHDKYQHLQTNFSGNYIQTVLELILHYIHNQKLIFLDFQLLYEIMSFFQEIICFIKLFTMRASCCWQFVIYIISSVRFMRFHICLFQFIDFWYLKG